MDARDEDVWRLLLDGPGDVDSVLDAGHGAGGADLAVVGHQAGVGADVAVRLDRPADAGVEPGVGLEPVERRGDGVGRRVDVGARLRGRIECPLSVLRLVGRRPGAAVCDDAHTFPPAGDGLPLAPGGAA